MVDALHLEHRAGNHFPGLPVPLEDGKIGELVVHRGDGDRAAAVNIRLIHMDDHRLRQPGKRRRDRDLYEGIQALSDAGDGDDAGGVRGLRSDDLAVLQDIEDSTLDGAVRIVHLQQFDLDLGIIFKDQIHIAFAVPVELLADFVGIAAGGVASGRGDLCCHEGADGHGVPGDVLQIAACAGGVGAGKAVIHTVDTDDGAGQPLGGIVRIHLTDGSLAGDLGGVREGDRDRFAVFIGQDHILGAGVVDLVPLRGLQFRDGIGICVQGGEGVGPVCPGHDLLGVGPIGILNEKPGAGQPLAGVGGVHLFHGQLILLMGDGEITDDDPLDVIGRMLCGAGASVGIFKNFAVAPDALSAQVENILGAVPERGPVYDIVNAGVAGVLQIVVDIHQLLCAGSHGISGKRLLLMAPDDSLHPGVHGPGIVTAPNLIHAQGMSLVCKNAAAVGVIIRHHGFDGRIADGLWVIPLVSLQRPAHAAPVVGAKACDSIAVVVKFHLVEPAGVEGCRLIVDTVMGAVLHDNGVRAGGQGRSGEQTQDTHQRQQHGEDPGRQRMRLFLHVLFLSSEKEGPKGQGILAERKQAVGAVSLRPVPVPIFKVLSVSPPSAAGERSLLRIGAA